jgi:ubiquinone/menaquinone biosynthesis C-methylase UbiE
VNTSEDVYTHGHSESVLRSHRWRTAENSAGYLLPSLRADSRILDVGCGPGTITVDLARRASAGSVVGMDRSESVIGEAQLAAEQAGTTNLTLGVGDVYSLDYPSQEFDVVHAHQVLQHLTDPVAALREMARVCRPGGVVAAQDADYSGFTWHPAVPELDDWLKLYLAVARGNRAEPNAGRFLKSWAMSAGLEVTSSGASVWCYSSQEEVAWWGGLWAERVVASDLAIQAVAGGWATRQQLERLADGWQRWASAPDAWFALLHGYVLCSAPR